MRINRWVVLSKIVLWEEFSRLYYKNFKSKRGAPTKDAGLVPGGDHHQAQHKDGRPRSDRDDPGEFIHAVFSWTRVISNFESPKFGKVDSPI